MSSSFAASTRRSPRGAPRAVAALFAVALLTTASVVCAQDRLALGWETCRLDGGTSDTVMPCGDPFATRSLVCSFRTAVSVDSVIGAELVLDVQSAGTPLPAYWQYGIGGCNNTQLTPSFPPSGTCADPWAGFGSALITDVYAGVPGGQPSQERIVVVVSLPAVQARILDAGTVYDAVRLVFSNGRPCAGCAVPACLVLNSIRLLRLPGAAEVLISGAESAADNFATWQGGAGADCQSVPADRSSWGTLKVRYR